MPRMRDDLARRRAKVVALGLQTNNISAWFQGAPGQVNLYDLTVWVRPEDEHGPFSTVEEAVNMLILLGGGI